MDPLLEIERAIWDQPNDDFAEVMNVLTNSFSAVRSLLERSGSHLNEDINRQIQQADLEFTRLRAQSMRQSMERRLFLQRQERRFRRRTDSDSSTDSDNSDIDLDCRLPAADYPKREETATTTATAAASSDATAAPTTDAAAPAATEQPIVDEAPTSSAAAAASSSGAPAAPAVSTLPTHKKTPSGEKKRKAVRETEQALPTKRTMATSTDDLLLLMSR